MIAPTLLRALSLASPESGAGIPHTGISVGAVG